MTELALLAVAVSLSLYAYRADFQRYSIFCYGVYKRVDRRVVETDRECHEDYCEQNVAPGEARRWYKEIVVLGMPVVKYGGGTHYYCADHVAFELYGTDLVPEKSTPEKLTITLVEGIGEYLIDTAEPDDDTPFDDVTTGVHDALSLVPVVLIVLIGAMIISLVKSVRIE